MNESDHDDKNKEEPEDVTREELIQQLENQVEYFEKLPAHEKFSFPVNADLYYFMLIVLNIFKKGLQ